MDEVLIPIVMFVALAIAISIGLMFRFRGRQEVQQTIRTAIDKGQELSPELLERLSDAVEPRKRDLRRGIVAVSVGIAFTVFAFVLGEEDAIRPLMGIAAFPFLVGVAYLILWRVSEQRA